MHIHKPFDGSESTIEQMHGLPEFVQKRCWRYAMTALSGLLAGYDPMTTWSHDAIRQLAEDAWAIGWGMYQQEPDDFE